MAFDDYESKALSRVPDPPNDPQICINFSSFLHESFCSIPDLKELRNPGMTDIPSFEDKIIKTRDVYHLKLIRCIKYQAQWFT